MYFKWRLIMKFFKSIMLPVACLGLLLSATPARADKTDMAISAAKTVGSALATVVSKTFGWGFGLTQAVLGGGMLAAGGLGAYALFLGHKRGQLENQSQDKTLQNLLVVGGTAVALPLGFIFVSKGLRNIWNA